MTWSIEGPPARGAVGRFGGKSAGRAIVVGVDARLIDAHLVHAAHDEQLFGERLERFENSGETFFLQRGRNAQSEKDIERPGGDGGRLRRGARDDHFFEQRQGDGNAAQSFEHRASADFCFVHTHILKLLFSLDGSHEIARENRGNQALIGSSCSLSLRMDAVNGGGLGFDERTADHELR
jgi:hypothetical protein